tara:strand:- start:474 stop:1454 length:981 start_codon:yes stop_codon:yes gene_type:complete
MAESSLISHLKEGDFKSCSPFLEKALLGGENLVSFLNDLLYIAASIECDDNEMVHPLVTMNCIKNIIGDNRTNPSKPLLSYSLHICKERKIINYNDAIQKKELEDESITSIFVGELEDALQACDWNGVDKLMPSIYYVSDRSRSIIDTIADLGLQNIDSNIVMIFHLLRAFNFKQKKSHVWTYACLLVNKIKSNPLPKPSRRKDCAPKDFIENIAGEKDVQKLVKYAAVSRIWDGDYVRLRSYRREISSWLYENFSISAENSMKDTQIKNRQIDFMSVAEKIILNGDSYNMISEKINILDALRYLNNIGCSINTKSHVDSLLRNEQ